MRWLLVFPIKVYRLIPPKFKRRCLFRETCSLFVMRAAMEGGLLAGCRALGHRFVRCRPKYSVSYDNASRAWIVILADGSAATGAEMADFVIEPYRGAVALAEARVRGMSV
ncbi:MAG TPA: membrane protein insertion efficiency factor YidD [Pyrinomonadaceae bacterium]|jgi:putative component of membrane protein insertase Oxa1/YidC/SpoIIIJ protein YidD